MNHKKSSQLGKTYQLGKMYQLGKTYQLGAYQLGKTYQLGAYQLGHVHCIQQSTKGKVPTAVWKMLNKKLFRLQILPQINVLI